MKTLVSNDVMMYQCNGGGGVLTISSANTIFLGGVRVQITLRVGLGIRDRFRVRS